MIGWAAVTGDIGLGAIALFTIIFLWTPPHSWALALFRRGDYAAADVPTEHTTGTPPTPTT